MAARRRLRVPRGGDAEGGAQGARRRARAADPRLRRRRSRRLPAPCATTRGSARRGCWRVTDREDSRAAVEALQAGADDYLPRPFTRTELLARVRAGVHAAQQRSDDTLLRALMVNVPGAIYRSAWHDDHKLALISDEIERISGYPPANFIASAKRTLMSIVHPDDRERILESVKHAHDHDRPFVLEYRIVRADGEIRWVLDRGQLIHGPGGRR